MATPYLADGYTVPGVEWVDEAQALYHLRVPGEHNSSQMAIIEDRLMEAISFGDHPRVSAVHKPDGRNVNNWHLHIVVSRIDPATLKAEHPRYNHFSLQAEAARLEIELGLKQERKTPLAREREEIGRLREFHGPELDPPTPGALAQRGERERQSLDQAHEQRHEAPRKIEQQAAHEPAIALVEGIRRRDARQRQGPVLHPQEEQPQPDLRLITDRQALERLKLDAGYHTPESIARALVPGFKELADTRARLREEAREAKIKRQELGWERDDNLKAEQGYRQGLSWWQRKLTDWHIVSDGNIAGFQHGAAAAEAKLAGLREAETARQSRLTAVDAAITAVLDRVQPAVAAYERIGRAARQRLREHYEAELDAGRKPRLAQWREKERPMEQNTPPLYERYKAERDVAYHERQTAEREVYDRFAAYEQELRGWYNVQFEQEKGSVLPGHARHDAIEILKAMRRGNRVEVQMLRDQQLAAARRAHPLPDWESWVKREAERGDPEAVRTVERRQARDQERGIEC